MGVKIMIKEKTTIIALEDNEATRISLTTNLLNCLLTALRKEDAIFRDDTDKKLIQELYEVTRELADFIY